MPCPPSTIPTIGCCDALTPPPEPAGFYTITYYSVAFGTDAQRAAVANAMAALANAHPWSSPKTSLTFEVIGGNPFPRSDTPNLTPFVSNALAMTGFTGDICVGRKGYAVRSVPTVFCIGVGLSARSNSGAFYPGGWVYTPVGPLFDIGSDAPSFSAPAPPPSPYSITFAFQVFHIAPPFNCGL